MAYYRDLRVWKLAHQLAIEVRKTTKSFPPEEKYDLTSQIRRASLSVPTNLAEGQARYGCRETLHFARISASSLAEVDYLLYYAKDYGYLGKEDYERLDALRKKHTSRVISRFIRSQDVAKQPVDPLRSSRSSQILAHRHHRPSPPFAVAFA